ncbi:MAG: hypothetical protein MUE54_03105 [Anaerolineae bacterium]|jgi:hypothetical protein|nr:hypothetical protein [Anaerolineae bacterium]
MRGCFGFFFYIIITIWVLFAFLLFVAIRSWAFDRQFYLDVADNDAVYNAFREEGLPEFLAELKVNGQQVLDPSSTAFPALVEATQAILPTDYLRTTTVGLVDNLFNFFENPQTGLTLNVDLTPIKASLGGAQGDAFASTYIRALETCATSALVPTDKLPTCKPAGVSDDEILAVVSDYKAGFVNSIPDTWNLAEDANMNWDGLPNVSLIEGLQTAFTVTATVTFAIWLLNAIIGGSGFKGLLMWMGGMLFLPALIVLLMGASFSGSLLDAISSDIIRDTTTSNLQASTQVQESVTLVILDALKRIGTGFLTTGSIALGVSLVLYIFGAIMRRPNRMVDVGAYYDSSHPIRPL